MLYGVSPCIIATVCHSFSASVLAPNQTKRHIYRMAFNVSSSVCCAWVFSNVYRLMNPNYSKDPYDIALPILVLALTFYLLNSFLTASAICLSTGQNIFRFWAKNYLPLGFEFSISSVSAAIIVALYQAGRWIPIIVAPFISVIWGWNKLNKAKAMEAEKHLKEQEALYLRTVESLALAVDAKDQTTYGHIRRVKVYATGLARLLGIRDPDEMKAIETGALLHDIGKLAIDDYILNKPGKLSKQEFEKIKMHAAAGDEILQQVNFPFPVAKYVRYHHERWDGQGYPDRLKGEEIPLGARILAIADAFDAIRFSRPYKLSIAMQEAVEILKSQSGIVFDPNLVRLFIENIDELEQAASKESENVPQLSFRKYFEKVDQDLIAADASSPEAPMSQDIPAELVQLAEFCSAMTGQLDLNDILPIVARRIERLIPFTTCVFYLDDGDDHVEATFVCGKYSEAIQGHKMSMGKGISGWVAAYHRHMINTGPALDFQGIKGDFTSFVDTLVVPVIYEDESLGTISLYAEEPISYGSQELGILRTLAGFLAPLIADARKQRTTSSEHFIDPITKMHRVSYLNAIGPQIISLAAKNRNPVSLIYIGIKNLFQLMRIYGEPVANSVVKKIADCIKPELRETDVLVRFGHQGFVAFLPGVRNEQALRCADRLKHQIRNQSLNVSGQNVPIDCQAGVSSYPANGTTIFSLIQSAQENITVEDSVGAAINSNVVDFPPRS
jgi:diguanylate cyclase (GGDEF)-like protein/putative nucleotidyltransferase with HDIG domain